MYSTGKAETDLLFLASREGMSETVGGRLAALIQTARLSPPILVRYCVMLKTYPLVCHTLAQCGELPDHLKSFGVTLHLLCSKWQRRRKQLERTYSAVSTAFVDERIPFAFLRGVPLADRFYLSPALRVSNDLDLLVHEIDVPAATGRLFDLGFDYREPEETRAARAKYMGQNELVNKQLNVGVDINWRLAGNGSIGSVDSPIEALWERAAVAPDGAWVLAKEDMLLDVVRHCCHGHDFGLCMLKSFSDVAAILRDRQSPLDWDYVCRQARRAEIQKAFLYFAWVYERYFRSDAEPQLLAWPNGRRSFLQTAQPALFAKTVSCPFLRLTGRPKTFARVLILANLGFVAKLWSLDRFARLAGLLRTIFVPSPELAALVAPAEASTRKRRLAYAFRLLLLTPSIVLGCLGFAVGAVGFKGLETHVNDE